MRALVTIAAVLAGGCAGADGPAPRPANAGGGETAARAGAPMPDRPPPRWWTRGDAACPDGARLERREESDGRVLTCRRGDTPHGPEVAWHENGVRRWERAYEAGELHGLWVRWYPSGARRSAIPYVHGRREGTARRWQTDGEIRERTRWEDGQIRERITYERARVKRAVRYHPNGQRAEDHRYANGARHGQATTWHPNGTVASRGPYRTGKKHGLWTYADAEGHVVREEVYREGELVSRREGGEIDSDLPDDVATGIAACDDLIRRARRCEGMPAANRDAFEQAADAWRRALEGADTRQMRAISRACQQVRKAWKQAFEDFGCSP